MKRYLIPVLVAISVISCKQENKEKNVAADSQTSSQNSNSQKTYAEISVKEGGQWEGREYMNGEFKNVESLEVPQEHTDHSWYIRYEGPGWENQQVGYRLYLDWRNAIDIFGKKVDTLVLPFVGQDGFDSYHENADWGQDILKAGKSMGIGGYGRYMNDTVAHFRNVNNTKARVNNSEGSSTVSINYEGWSTGTDTIDLEASLSIFPEGRFTKAELTPSKEITGLTTGIVKHGPELMTGTSDNGEWAYIANYGAQTLVNDQDNLGMALFYKTKQLDRQIEGTDDHLVIFKPTTKTITYYFLAAWEQEKDGITSEDEFKTHVAEVLEELNSNTLK
ncbi:uncharacterized protein DUF4861 [Gramella sp. Hel_I_59]|uniref:DUF4861 family protein n=1 Tax=Gramella sp. Hel_I_59 TaxID=1249978 RepID=UPI001154B2E8|nr:DUF4861 family protein [Gramella sp. Hel_I_59]TQI69313.1 uncharacterized protein DUF4861 [Gramella sp. Hel_I_59]